MSNREDNSVQVEPLAQAGKFKRWLRPVMNLLAGVFVILAARDLVRSWEGSKVSIAPGAAAVACIPLVLSCFAQGIAWIVLVERMADRRVPRMRAMALYLLSQLARYTPGKVGLPLVRMEGAPRLGLTRTLVGISVLVESLSWTATGAVLGFALLSATAPSAGLGGAVGRMALPGFIAALVGLIALLVVDRRYIPAKIRLVIAPGGSGPVVALRVPLVQIGYWALVAVHGLLLSRALGASAQAGLTAMGFYVIASVAGFVVLAAPAGLGVREAVLLAGLSPSVGAAGALGAVVISRAASLVAEVLVWIVVRALCSSEASAPS